MSRNNEAYLALSDKELKAHIANVERAVSESQGDSEKAVYGEELEAAKEELDLRLRRS